MYYVRDQFVQEKKNGVNKIAAVIDADTFTDLPAYNECKGVDGELTVGTVALVADECCFYSLTSSGTWNKKED